MDFPSAVSLPATLDLPKNLKRLADDEISIFELSSTSSRVGKAHIA